GADLPSRSARIDDGDAVTQLVELPDGGPQVYDSAGAVSGQIAGRRLGPGGHDNHVGVGQSRIVSGNALPGLYLDAGSSQLPQLIFQQPAEVGAVGRQGGH